MSEEYIIPNSEKARACHAFLEEKEGCPKIFLIDKPGGSKTEYVLRPIPNPYSSNADLQYKRHDRYSLEVVEVPPDKHISDIVGDSYQEWSLGDVIWMNVRCGSGKTTLFLNSLNYYRDNGYKVLYIGSREQLLAQTKISVAKRLGSEYAKYPPEHMKPIENVENFVFFATYQKLASVYRDGRKFREDIFSEKTKTVVFLDEAHWLTSDALFSLEPDEFLDGFIKQFRTAIKVFMTATDWDCLEPIVDALPRINGVKITNNGDIMIYDPHCGEYRIDGQLFVMPDEKEANKEMFANIRFHKTFLGRSEPKNITTFSYSSLEEMLPKIKEESSGKWLILVESKKKGFWLKGKIPGSSFVFRENDEYIMTEDDAEEKSRIATAETFNARVLITTTILDVGTNISDKEVRNVVVDAWDPVTVVQFVGRKRGKDRINLYLHDRSTDEVVRLLEDRVNKPLNTMYWAVKSGDASKNSNLNEVAELLEHGLACFQGSKLAVNRMAVIKFRNLRKYLHHILYETALYEDKTFLANQLELFGLTLAECKDITSESKERTSSDLIAYIDSLTDRKLSKVEYEAFCQKFDSFLKELGTCKHRGAKKYEAENLNDVLSANKLPFTAENKGGKYFLKRVDGQSTH